MRPRGAPCSRPGLRSGPPETGEPAVFTLPVPAGEERECARYGGAREGTLCFRTASFGSAYRRSEG